MKKNLWNCIQKYGFSSLIVSLDLMFMDHLRLTGWQEMGQLGFMVAYAAGVAWAGYYEEKS